MAFFCLFVLLLHRHEAATRGRDPDWQEAADLSGYSGRQDDPEDRRHPKPGRERGLKASWNTLRFLSCSRGCRHFPEHHVQTALHIAIYHLIPNVQAVVVSKSPLKCWSADVSRLCSSDFKPAMLNLIILYLCIPCQVCITCHIKLTQFPKKSAS